MFWNKNKKKVYPCKPQFYYIKVGCKGVFVTRTCFRDVMDFCKLYTSVIIHYTIIDSNEVDIRIYIPEKVIFIEAARPW